MKKTLNLLIKKLEKILIIELCIFLVLLFIFMNSVYSIAIEKNKVVINATEEISSVMIKSTEDINTAIDKKIEKERKAKEEEEKKKQEKEREVREKVNAAIPSGDAKEAFFNIVSEKGLSASDAEGWANIISRESNWRVNARNQSSGAYGLGQALPGSKMAVFGSDWETNPRTQLNWMYSYMIDRYGSISAAAQFFNSNGWY